MRNSFVLAFLSIAIIQTTFSQGFTGDTWKEALKNKRANVILTNVHRTDFSEMKEGKGSGLCFDIMDDFASYVARKYGVQITYEYRPVSDPSNFQLFLSAVENSQGGVFGLGDITITDQRKTVYDFTPPYFSNMAVLITSKDVPELTALANIPVTFKGMRAVSQGGTTHDERLKELKRKHGDFQIIYTASSSDKTILLLTSPKYFTYLDLPNYLEIYASGKNVKRHAVGDIPGEYYGFILPKENDWTPIVTEFFQANGGYLKSEDYQTALSNNLSPEVVKLLDEIAN